MLSTAFYRMNFPLLALACESFRTYKLPVNAQFLGRLEKFLVDVRSKILAMVCTSDTITSIICLLSLYRNMPMSRLITIDF